MVVSLAFSAAPKPALQHRLVCVQLPRDPVKSENAWFLRGCHPGGWHLFEFLKMHLYQYTQKNRALFQQI